MVVAPVAATEARLRGGCLEEDGATTVVLEGTVQGHAEAGVGGDLVLEGTVCLRTHWL